MEPSWGSRVPSWGHFGALECRVESNFELLKAILSLLKTVFRPRKEATAKVSGQKRNKLIKTLVFLRFLMQATANVSGQKNEKRTKTCVFHMFLMQTTASLSCRKRENVKQTIVFHMFLINFQEIKKTKSSPSAARGGGRRGGFSFL